LDNQNRAGEAEKESWPAPHNPNTTPGPLPATQTPTTVSGTHPSPMDLSTNWRTLTTKEYQKWIMEG
jgi:hypothetical protein